MNLLECQSANVRRKRRILVRRLFGVMARRFLEECFFIADLLSCHQPSQLLQQHSIQLVIHNCNPKSRHYSAVGDFDTDMPSDANPGPPTTMGHANRHVQSFLSLKEEDSSSSSSNSIQIIDDGKLLTAERILKNDGITLSRPILVRDTPESIGMKVLKVPKRQVTVADIAGIIGESYPIHVIDVEHQEELEGWTLGDLVDYFEDENRRHFQHPTGSNKTEAAPRPEKRRRKAAVKALQKTSMRRPRVLNQISLEFSKTSLRSQIQSPQFVRDIDWIDNAWPRRPSEKEAEVFPDVQYYCLTSAGGSYTDFHIDFGGTSVWYHVLSGEKCFRLIAPTTENLARYEEWLCRPDQATSFLPDLIENKNDIIRISLQASQTLVIPTAWIHAVYTPIDSVVIGGNFLHGMEMKKQLDVHGIESRTKVQEKFRFPFFLPLHFYAGGMYLEKLRRGQVCRQEVEGFQNFVDALDTWWKVHNGPPQFQSGPTIVGAANEAANKNSCLTVEELLAELRKEHSRVSEQGISPNKDYTPAHSPAKPKLKLKLKSLESNLPKEELLKKSVPERTKSHTSEPKLRLKLKGDRVSKSSSGGNDDSNFRIVVSSAAVKASSTSMPRPKPKKGREDTEWVDNGIAVDDDWMPRMKSKQKKSESSGRARPQGGPIKAKASPKSTSARQRLLKRFR